MWDHFFRLAAVPRPSKNEGRVAAHVLDLAKSAGLTAQQDPTGNIVVRKPASRGKEKGPMVALQSHLDMVCEKNRDVQHDFNRDGIQLVRNGGYICARGTTLGADNGIGVAAALTVMLDPSLEHGPLELLFTVDEETGLTGANGLRSEFVKSRLLLNLDTEEEGSLYVGCAGGRDTLLTFGIGREQTPAGYLPFILVVKGLKGGHSGVEIHVGRGNALKLLGRALWEISRKINLRLVRMEGGSKRNAIPREAEALVLVDPSDGDKLKDLVKQIDETAKAEYATVDPGLELQARTDGAGTSEHPLRRADQDRIISILHTLPHGVMAMSADIPGLVETSTNVATIETSPEKIIVGTSQRSSVGSALHNMVSVVEAMGLLAGASIEKTDGYPGWKPNLESQSLKVASKAYKELFGKEPAVKAIHAGLECGIIGEKFPGMDMVSLGPTIEGAHSPDERVEIASVQKFWNLLLKILKNLSE